MPTHGRRWDVRVVAKTVITWKRRQKWSRKRIASEVDAWADDQGIDKQGRTVSERLVREWTEGVPRDGQRWDMTQAPLDEIAQVAKVYAWVRQKDGPEAPWPTVGQARWWTRLGMLVKGMPPEEVYETGLYADTRSGEDQRKISVQLLEYYAREPELLAEAKARAASRMGARPGPDEPAIGGTAIADKVYQGGDAGDGFTYVDLSEDR